MTAEQRVHVGSSRPGGGRGADVGELIARLVDALIVAGRSEPDARDANVHQLAGASEQEA